jgi:hypothetical protein
MGRNSVQIGEVGRQAERVAVDGAARLRPNSWSSVEATMVDLSALGFRAECEARLQPGATVTLDIPGLGPVGAQVEWHRGHEFGARFFEPIDLDRCSWTLRERHNALAQLLVARAQARTAGRDGAEAQIRRQILGALPMHKDGRPA